MPAHDTTAAARPVRVDELLAVVSACGWSDRAPRLLGDGAVPVRDVTHVGSEAASGTLYAARPGAVVDGHDFAAQAVGRGAVALLVERPLDLAVPQLVVESTVRVLGPVAAAVHGHPSAQLCLLGVTGTNGKTTTAHLLEAALSADGHETGLLGTVTTRLAGHEVPGVRTTPEATDLQRLLATMRDRGVTAAAMEVSSHGLALRRVDGTRLSAAAFTNLSQDHLDFHADLEHYEAAKRRLFSRSFTDRAAVDVDSPAGVRMADAARAAGLRVATVSTCGGAADLTVRDARMRPDGSDFTAVTSGELADGRVPLRLALPGPFNVANAALALATAVLAGVGAEAAAAGIGLLGGVPGRLERVEAGQDFAVLVDYAHTPEAVATVLDALRAVTPGRLIVVLGCGGDRDREKRPLMGEAAAAGADLAVLTSDNPRSEEPLAILEAMRRGADAVPGGRVHTEPDRGAAIALALSMADPGDAVLIAGKGHEPYQEIGDRRLPFDDRCVARRLLSGGRR